MARRCRRRSCTVFAQFDVRILRGNRRAPAQSGPGFPVQSAVAARTATVADEENVGQAGGTRDGDGRARTWNIAEAPPWRRRDARARELQAPVVEVTGTGARQHAENVYAEVASGKDCGRKIARFDIVCTQPIARLSAVRQVCQPAAVPELTAVCAEERHPARAARGYGREPFLRSAENDAVELAPRLRGIAGPGRVQLVGTRDGDVNVEPLVRL